MIAVVRVAGNPRTESDAFLNKMRDLTDCLQLGPIDALDL